MGAPRTHSDPGQRRRDQRRRDRHREDDRDDRRAQRDVARDLGRHDRRDQVGDLGRIQPQQGGQGPGHEPEPRVDDRRAREVAFPRDDRGGERQDRDREQEGEVERDQPSVRVDDVAERPVVADPERGDHQEADAEGEDRRPERRQGLQERGVGLPGRQLRNTEVDRQQRDRDREHGVREEDDALEGEGKQPVLARERVGRGIRRGRWHRVDCGGRAAPPPVEWP